MEQVEEAEFNTTAVCYSPDKTESLRIPNIKNLNKRQEKNNWIGTITLQWRTFTGQNLWQLVTAVAILLQIRDKNPSSKVLAKFQQYFWAILSPSDSVFELSVEWEVWIEEMFSWVSSFSHFSITYIGRAQRKKKKKNPTLQTVHCFLSELLSSLAKPTLTPSKVSRNAEGCNSYSSIQRIKSQEQSSFYNQIFAGPSSYGYPHETY